MAGLGDLFAEKKPPEKPTKMTPDPRGGFDEFLSRPEVLAFMLQSAASMLSGEGVGRAFGEGAGAMGRYGAAKSQADKEAELEARRRFESDRDYNLRMMQFQRGGAGGGGSDSSDSSKLFGKTASEWAKILYDQDYKAWKAKADNAMPGEDAGPPPDRLVYEMEGQKIVTALQNGMPLETYLQGRASGDTAAAGEYANIWARDPQKAKKAAEDVVKMNTIPPDQPSMEMLGMPALPGGGGAPPIPSPMSPVLSPTPGIGMVPPGAPNPSMSWLEQLFGNPFK